MATGNAQIDAKYTLKYAGNPTTDAGISKALVGAGVLSAHKEHPLTAMAPDAFEIDTNDGERRLMYQTDVHAVIVGGVMFAQDMNDVAMHWAARGPRMAVLFKHIVQTGI